MTAPRNAAMAQAEALFAAAGRAERLAAEATADWFNPPKKRLIRRWYLYAWATREGTPDDIEWFRALLRNSVACYRVLRPQDAGERPMRRAA